MATKRKSEEFDVGDLKESGNAIAHGVVTELSPVKKSKRNEKVNYFSGQICDSKSCVRVVSFEPALRKAMCEAMEKKDSVCLVGCEVRRGVSGGSEIVMSKMAKVERSPQKFDSSTLVVAQKQASAVVEVNDVNSLATNQQVTVTVKVKKVDSSEKVKNRDGKEQEKQDCVVGDASGCTRVVLWEGDVNWLEEGGCYKLVGASVRSFRGVSYLSVGGDCTIESVDEIGEIAEVDEGDLQESGVVRKVVEGENDGVLYSDEYSGCIACNAKVKSEDDILGECTKCGMLMKVEKCKKLATARVAVSDQNGKSYKFTMFDSVIANVNDGVDGVDMKRKLLRAPAFRFNIDKGDVVYSVMKL